MTRTTKLLFAAALGAACALALNAQTPSRSFVIRDVHVFDGAHTIEHQDVVVTDGIIQSLKKADGKGLQAILFSGSTTLGPFAFQIDDVQLVKP